MAMLLKNGFILTQKPSFSVPNKKFKSLHNLTFIATSFQWVWITQQLPIFTPTLFFIYLHGMTDIIEHMEWRYAVKKFDPTKTLSEEKVQRLKEAFNLTATSYGLQPIKMVVVKDKGLREKLVAHTYGQLQVVHASHLLVICIENVVDAEFIINYFQRVQHVRGTSDQILNPYKEALVKDFSSKKKTEIKQWAINQAYLALGNLMTICALERIDSCPMEGFDPVGYDSLLGLDEKGLTSVLVMPVGYRAESDMFSEFKKVRRGLNDSIIEM